MLKKLEKGSCAGRRRSDATEVRLLVIALFPWFFVAAVARRVLAPARGDSRRLSCFEQARRSTYSVIPYALMQ